MLPRKRDIPPPGNRPARLLDHPRPAPKRLRGMLPGMEIVSSEKRDTPSTPAPRADVFFDPNGNCPCTSAGPTAVARANCGIDCKCRGSRSDAGPAESWFDDSSCTEEAPQRRSARAPDDKSRNPLSASRAKRWLVLHGNWCTWRPGQCGCRRAPRGTRRISDARGARCASLGRDRCCKRGPSWGDAHRPRDTRCSLDDHGSPTRAASRLRGTFRTTPHRRVGESRAACGRSCTSFLRRARRYPTRRSSDDSRCRRSPSR